MGCPKFSKFNWLLYFTIPNSVILKFIRRLDRVTSHTSLLLKSNANQRIRIHSGTFEILNVKQNQFAIQVAHAPRRTATVQIEPGSRKVRLYQSRTEQRLRERSTWSSHSLACLHVFKILPPTLQGDCKYSQLVLGRCNTPEADKWRDLVKEGDTIWGTLTPSRDNVHC